MNKIIDFLHKPPIIALGTLLTLAGVIGFIDSIFPEQKRPFFTAKSSTINSNKINDNFGKKVIEFNHVNDCNNIEDSDNCQKRQLSHITTTKIMIWNGGRKTIDKTDIEDNPLSIITKNNIEILDVALLNTSNSSNNVDINKNKIHLSFLESGDGFVIEIIHTGKSEKDLDIEGYIKDSGFKNYFDNFKYIVRSNLYSSQDYIVVFVSYVYTAILSFLFFIIKDKKSLNI